MNHRTTKLTCCAAVALFFAFVSTGSAQVFAGRVDVIVEDSTGGRMPGVKVDLTGPIDQVQPTDARGETHFVNLPVGVYALKAQMQGFDPYTISRVEVVSNASTPVIARLAVGGASGTIEVTAATPVIDVRKATTTTNVTLDELQGTPSSRDPWVVLQTVPTVYVDRVNVGGSESGQQSNYNAKGAQDKDNTWTIDGVPVTDMGATGTSAFYYDFDSLQEIAVTTGGADARSATAGVQLNVVLKMGLNEPHGGARGYLETEKLQGNNLSSTLAQTIGGSTDACKNSAYTKHCGNRTDRYLDRGFDLGGPVFKDQLWAWGTIAQTNIRLRTLDGLIDETTFDNYAFKVDGQATDNIRGTFSFYENNKVKNGRDAGPLRPPETAWNQTGPTRYFKGEGHFVVNSRFFAAARVAYLDGRFQLAPVGGLSTDYYIDDGGVAHNSFFQSQSTRPQHYVGGDANYFGGKHEVKFGAAWRSTPVDTQQIWPASHLVATWVGYPNMYVQVARDYRALTDAKYVNGYVTDTISLDRMTITGGLRFDRQVSSLGAATVPGVPGIPILPALSAPAVNGVYKWNTVTPRVGVNYALDESRKTLVRASYAMFASQLPGSAAAFVSPIQYSYAYYNAVDRTSSGAPCTAEMAPPFSAGGCDGVAQLSEIRFDQGLQGHTGFDPNNPTRLSTVNQVDPNLKAPRTHELLFGVDRQVMPNLGVSATFTYRRMTDLVWDRLTGVRPSDYRQAGTLSGTVAEVGPYNVPLYALNLSALPRDSGQTETNRQGYHQRYWGVEFSATKRMSNRWMARFGFSTNDWREYFDDPSTSIVDPTRAPGPTLPARPFAGPQVNGGLVVRQSNGSGKSNIYMVAPTYQFVANGVYEGPWDLNFGANLVTRQGYAEPFFRSQVVTGDPLGRKTVMLVSHVDDFRLDPVTSLDGRVEKKFRFNTMNIAVDFDVFNLFNAGTVLEKQYDARTAGPTGFDQVLAIMNPRIARIGVRFFF